MSLRVVQMKTRECIEAESSLQISRNCILCVLSQESLNIAEFDLFAFLLKWGQRQSPEHWKELIYPCLELIRFPLMMFQQLNEVVAPLRLLSEQTLKEALDFSQGIESRESIQPTAKRRKLENTFSQHESLPLRFRPRRGML